MLAYLQDKKSYLHGISLFVYCHLTVAFSSTAGASVLAWLQAFRLRSLLRHFASSELHSTQNYFIWVLYFGIVSRNILSFGEHCTYSQQTYLTISLNLFPSVFLFSSSPVPPVFCGQVVGHALVEAGSTAATMLKRLDKIRFRGQRRDELLDLAESPNTSDTECNEEVVMKPRLSVRDSEELREVEGEQQSDAQVGNHLWNMN